jgi:hypothetical protein
VLRDFTIADIGALNAGSKQALFLNNQAVLTRGPKAVLRRALLTPLGSLSTTFTAVAHNAEGRVGLLAQAELRAGAPLAQCNFVSPHAALNSSALLEAIDYLLKKSGERGAQGLLAELDEHSAGFAALRTAGFSIYARQRIWKLERAPRGIAGESAWHPALERDRFAIQLLQGSLLPGQVQQFEGEASLDGYVYFRGEQLVAYAEIRRGGHGIWLQPFVHLDAEPFHEPFLDLVNRLHPRPGRPLYISVRSYQDWLEKILEDFGAQPGPRQVAMARRTVVPLKVEKAQRAAPAAHIEPTTPIHVPSRRREPEWMTYDKTPNYR